MADELAILLVEDSEDDAALILRALRKGGIEPVSRRVDTADGVREALQTQDWDLILSDFSMPRFGGEQALRIVREMRPELPFILVSGAVGEETAVRILHEGACDFVMKDNLARLAPAVRRALREADERRSRAAAEQALRESEARFRTLVENIPGAVYRCELSPPWPMSFMSSMVENLTGYPVADFLTGKVLFGNLILAEDLERVTATVEEAVARGSAFEVEYRLRHADGSVRWLHEKGKAVSAGGATAPWLDGVILDITARKTIEEERERLEKQLRQAQKMEAIGTLAGGIAHDFNNVLSAILGYTELLELSLAANTRELSYVHEVLKAGNRAKELVRQILTFSRMSDKQRVAVEVATVVREALSLLRASIPTTVAIRHHLEPGSGAILADPTQIHQVLMNLCTNAAQAMEEKGGILEVRVEAVEIPGEELTGSAGAGGKAYIRLAVSDTGMGIAPEILDRVFDPYFTTKDVGKGTGMGLAVVQGIVRNLGGFVRVESALGRGTTFKVFFPLASQAPAQNAVATADGAIPHGTGRILLVDDETMLIDLGKTMLEGLGYSVTSLLSSSEALEQFRQDPDLFDLVITDQTMPGLPGTELARKLLTIRPDLPIFLCTGYSSMVDEDKAKALGIRTFLMKPFKLPVLAQAVHEALGGRKSQGPGVKDEKRERDSWPPPIPA